MNQSTEEINPVPKEYLLKHAEINILLSCYNDIFSDFDPSAFAERILSDDFIIQTKKISKAKSGNKILLRLLLPANKRNEEDEKVIIERLHSYFKNVHHQLVSEIRKINMRGLILTLIGTAIMIAASYISFIKPEKYSVHLLLVLFEPAGWFLLWFGLDHLVYSSKAPKKELDFYSRMIKSEIRFFTNHN